MCGGENMFGYRVLMGHLNEKDFWKTWTKVGGYRNVP